MPTQTRFMSELCIKYEKSGPKKAGMSLRLLSWLKGWGWGGVGEWKLRNFCVVV